MSNVFQVGAKYLIILLFALFTYFSYRVQQDRPEETKRWKYVVQAVLVFLVHALAFANIMLNRDQMNSVTGVQVMLLYAAQVLYLVFMLIVLPKIVNLSRGLNNVMCMMLCVGFFIQTRLSFSVAVRMMIYLAAATVIFLIFQIIYKLVSIMHRLTWAYCAASLALLLAVFAFASLTKGAKISIDLGFISIQPFEFVKILFVLFVAGAFNKANNLKTVFSTAALAVVHVLLLVACTELGTALILCVVYVLMLYVATKQFRYVLIGAAGFAVACVAAYFLFAHVRVRVSAWLNPWTDINNTGYQVTQSLFAIGSGGWLGTGLFRGDPEYVPLVSNDFVFSAISEEMGAAFSVFLILLCLCFTLMIFRIAIRIYKPFYKLTAFGLGSAYAFQVFLTVGGALKFVPSTGINLPFISSGGSSLMASMLMLGIVQGLYVISERDVEFEREIIEDRIINGAIEDEELQEQLIRKEPSGGVAAEKPRKSSRVVQVSADKVETAVQEDSIFNEAKGKGPVKIQIYKSEDDDGPGQGFIRKVNESIDEAGEGKRAKADDTVVISDTKVFRR